MFKTAQNPKNTQSNQAQIGADVRITGRIDSENQLVLGGRLDGDVHADEIEITASGSVTGNVTARHVIVAGKVHGDISAEHLLIAQTAQVKGALMYQTVEIETGAEVEGEFKRTQNAAATLPVFADSEEAADE